MDLQRVDLPQFVLLPLAAARARLQRDRRAFLGAAASGAGMSGSRSESEAAGAHASDGGRPAAVPSEPQRLEVTSFATEDDPKILYRQCVDCGVRTGRFCDWCRAVDRFPQGDATGRGWADGQLTPLCSACDNARARCHFCLDIWVTKPVEIYAGVGASASSCLWRKSG